MFGLFLPFRLAKRELRGGLKGFYVFILCLMLGVSMIAGVQSLSRGLEESIRMDGRYILGGDMALRTIYEQVTKEQHAFLMRVGPMAIVMETRAMARSVDGEHTSLIELKAVDPFYPLYGEMRFVDEDGNKIEAEGGVQGFILPENMAEYEAGRSEWGAAVEPEILERLNLHLGDYIYIGDKRFQLKAIIDHEPDRMGSMRPSLGPRIMISRSIFDETGLRQKGSQIYFDHKILMPYVKKWSDMEEKMNAIVEAFPDASWQGRTFANASPTLRKFLDRMTLFLSFVGLTALLVGGVGIGNAVRSFLDEKLSHIATMKCLGASGKVIFRVYFLQILFLSLIGILLGLVVGASIPFTIGPLLVDKLSLENHMAVYPDVLGIAALFGLLTVLTFSLWPIGRACRVPPRDLFRDRITPSSKWPGLNYIVSAICAAEALACLIIFTTTDQKFAIYFVIGTVITFLVFIIAAWIVKYMTRVLVKIRNPDLRMAFANLYRPGNVTTSIILSLGLGLTVLVSIALVESNMSSTLNKNISDQTPSFYFLDVQPSQLGAFSQEVMNVKTTDNLVLLPSLRGRISKVNGKPALESLINPEHSWVVHADRAFTYTDTLPPNSEVIKGEWWVKDYKGAALVSIAEAVAEAFEIGVGDELTVNILGKEITAEIASVRKVNWGSFAMNFAVTFSPGVLNNMPATYIGTVQLNQSKEEDLQRSLANAFPNVTSIRVKDALDTANKILKNVAQAIRLSALVAFIAGILVLAGGIATGNRRRVYDSVILKVIGLTRGRIFGGFMLEYLLLGLITAFIAGVLGTITAWFLQTKMMGMDWVFDLQAVLMTSIICLVITLLFGWVGTWRVLGNKPAPMLRND